MVVVVGMHRSGTSAITQLLELAGLEAAPEDDELPRTKWNARGNREFRSLTEFNNRILEALGGRWDSPPPLPPGWERAEVLRTFDDDARTAFAQLPSGAVWKDPRLSLVLPFWEQALDRTFAVVLVLRHPAEVADSLRRRNKFPPALGLALWERYVRVALGSLSGHRVLVARYDDALTDPIAFVTQAREVLGSFGVELGDVAPTATIRETADPTLRHATRAPGTDTLLSTEQQGLLAVIENLPAVADHFVLPDFGPETTTTQSLLDAHGRTSAERSASPPRGSMLAQRLRRIVNR
jgi:hypothetical protein